MDSSQSCVPHGSASSGTQSAVEQSAVSLVVMSESRGRNRSDASSTTQNTKHASAALTVSTFSNLADVRFI